MEQYLRRSRLGSAMDDLGLRAVIALAAVLWFVYLWGLGMPAILAGLALGLMGQMALTRYRRRTVSHRETALRQRLGGEMLLEDMLLSSARQAHFQAAMLLGQKHQLTMLRVTEEGILCRYGEETLLIACLRMTAEGAATPDALLPCLRACREYGAQRCVACVMGKCPVATQAWAEESKIPLRLISREELLLLAGQASPATDDQLVVLGKRKNRHDGWKYLQSRILRRDKAKRYMLYGTMLLMVYVLTGLPYYPLPGLACLVLAVGSRYFSRGKETL